MGMATNFAKANEPPQSPSPSTASTSTPTPSLSLGHGPVQRPVQPSTQAAASTTTVHQPLLNSDPSRSTLAPSPVQPAPNQPGSVARARFRTAVHTVCAAQKVVSGASSATVDSSSQQGYQWTYTDRPEPGVNPHQPQPQLAHLTHLPVTVDVVDYSEDRVEFQSFLPALGSELGRLDQALKSPAPGMALQSGGRRPGWSSVRWISVNGLSWQVIRLLALRYPLHPLAVEDCVHTSARSKSEYYKHHLFVHAAVHTLVEAADGLGTGAAEKKARHRGDGPSEQVLESGIIDPDVDTSASTDGWKSPQDDSALGSQPMMDLDTATSHSPLLKEVFDAEREVVRQLTRDYKVRIHVEKLSIFLLRDGTLITIFSHDGAKTVSPVLNRLKSADTLLRTSADASMLLQALLDLIVDQALDVVEAFRSKLTSLEAKVLVSPDLDTVRHLHVLSGELLLLKRSLTPLSTLVHGIINHDPCGRNLSNFRSGPRSMASGFIPDDTLSINTSTSSGFISSQTRVYLSDILDHIDSVLSSLELFSGLASNLVDFTFNTMSFSTNESMRQLSTVTIIFLPLTFLTGYFGMNFVRFHAIQGSDAFFWALAVPITTVMVLMFTFDSLKRNIKVRIASSNVKLNRKSNNKNGVDGRSKRDGGGRDSGAGGGGGR